MAISDDSHLMSVSSCIFFRNLYGQYLLYLIYSLFLVSLANLKALIIFSRMFIASQMFDGLMLWISCFLGSADFVYMGSVSVCLPHDVRIFLRLVDSFSVHYQFNYLVFNNCMI